MRRAEENLLSQVNLLIWKAWVRKGFKIERTRRVAAIESSQYLVEFAAITRAWGRDELMLVTEVIVRIGTDA